MLTNDFRVFGNICFLWDTKYCILHKGFTIETMPMPVVIMFSLN